MKPAGAFLSLDSENGQTLKLEWEKGYPTDLLLNLMKRGVSIRNINIRRLLEEIETECNGDPWSINREILEKAIIYDVLSVYKIKSGDRRDIILSIEGFWVSDNPFYPPVVSNSQGELLLEGIYPGIHRFQNPDTKEQLGILVKEEGFEWLLH